MDRSADEVAARLTLAVGRIDRRMRPAAGGLSNGLLSALAAIVKRGPLRPGDLAVLEAVSSPTITRLVAALEAKGLVHRVGDDSDRRSYLLEATDAGTQTVLRARSERARLVAELLRTLGDDELRAIGGALDALDAAASAPLDRA